MEEYNAVEAARILGISDKTIRRHLRKGTIQARRKASGELKISADELEKLRLILELDDESRHGQQRAPIDRLEQADLPRQVETSIEERLASLAQSVANLNATVASQTRRLDELSSRVTELESRQVHPAEKPHTPVIANSPLPRSMPTPPPDVPSDAVLASDFLEGLGFKETSYRRWLKKWSENGLVEIIEVPRKGNLGVYRYLTPEQQERVIELLKAEGKL